MVPDGAEMIDGKFVVKEVEKTTNMITNLKRPERMAAQTRENVGDCGICYEPVYVAPGQLISKGKLGISHKACRGRGKNKTKGYG
jgi:hypothetical protein